MSPHIRIFNLLHQRPWVIEAADLARMIDIVDSHSANEAAIEALAARSGKPLDYTQRRAEMREGGTAVLTVEGPLFKRANLMTEMSGATSIGTLQKDFQAALDDPQVKQILLNIDSPGGEADGISELADRIRAASKPVTAYVDGLAASGAYWLASAAQRIVTSEAAFLGSIGAVATIFDRRPAQERQGVRKYEFVSTQSPYKRADPATDQGAAQIQTLVDSVASLFISKVAKFRGTTEQRVIEDFGKGSLVPAAAAVSSGMADSIGNYEDLVHELAAGPKPSAIYIGASQPNLTVYNSTGAIIARYPLPQPETEGGLLMADVITSQTTPTLTQPAAPITPMAAAPVLTTMNSVIPGNNISISPGTTAGISVANPSSLYIAGTDQAKVERQRIRAILTMPEAEGREALARHIALETDLDPSQAAGLLKAAPAESKAAAANPLSAAMAAVPNPKVGVTPDNDESDSSLAASILKHVPPAQLRAVK